MIPSRWLAVTSLLFACTVPAMTQQDALQEQVDVNSFSKNPALAHVRVDQQMGAKLPMQAQFRDETGRLIPFGSLFRGHPIVLLPIFYNCTGVCNIELQGVLNALIKIPKLVPGRDLDVVALSINPTEGPPLAKGKKESTLDEYGKTKTADGWHFLTGDLKDIRLVTDATGFQFTYDPVKNVVNHPSGVMVLTPDGRVSSYMLTGTYQPSALEADVSRAARAQIAAKSDDLFFGCIHSDPITGRRSIVIQNVLKLLGIMTIVALFGTIVMLSVRSRRVIA